MGLVSFLPKLFNYGKRVAKVYPELVFGKGGDVLVDAMKTTKGSIFTKADAGWKALEATTKANKVGFFRGTWNSLKSLVPNALNSTKAGIRLAGMKGTSKILGAFKGLGKGLSKSMPFIASAAMVLFELPNIITAVKEKGLIQGVKETGKAAAKLGGGALGAAIGQALIPIPFVGGAIGWIAGEWLTSKVVGKSYTEQKEEAAEMVQEQAAQYPQPMVQPAYTPYGSGLNFTGTTNPFQYGGNNYANDLMFQQLKLTA